MSFKRIQHASPFSLFFRSWPEMLRLQTLDRLLSDGRLHSMESLVMECSLALEEQGERGVSSKNTILNDLETLKNVWNVNICAVKEGRNIGYRYAENGFSVFSVEYDSEELCELQKLMQFLAPLRATSGFEWSADLLTSMEKAYGLQQFSDKYVSFENCTDVVGSDVFISLYQAIAKQQLVIIIYKCFWWKEPKELVVSPYFLKQYNQRWYLLANNENSGKIALYGLDRILELRYVVGTYTPCCINPKNYFSGIVGVTNHEGKSVEKVVLRVDSSYFNYIDNRPVHFSQMVLSENDDYVQIQLQLKVNLEFEKFLMANALNLKVEKPVWLRQRIANKLKKSLESYK